MPTNAKLDVHLYLANHRDKSSILSTHTKKCEQIGHLPITDCSPGLKKTKIYMDTSTIQTVRMLCPCKEDDRQMKEKRQLQYIL